MGKVSMTDLTEGAILRKIIIFSLPIIGGNMLQQLYNVTDALIVGKTLGVLRLAAVGAAGALNFFMLGFIIGLTGGCSVIIAQTYGAKDMAGVRRAVAAHITIAASFAAVMTVVFLLAARPALTLMRCTADTVEYSAAYITIMFQGTAATMLYNMLAASLRAVGDSKTPLKFLLFSSLLNIALDLLFIVVFRWDVQGAARATVLAQLISGVLCIFYLRKRAPFLIPDRSCWRGLRPVILRELRVGVPMGLQFTVISLGMIIRQGVVNGFGSSAVAAVTVGNKMHELMVNPLTAIATAMATYVAQNLGAKRYDRIRVGARRCAVFAFAISCSIAAIVFLLREPIIGLFVAGHEVEVFSYAKWCLNWECVGFTIICFLVIYRGSVQGLGLGAVVVLTGIMELVMRLVVCVWGAQYIGFTAVCVAGPLAWLTGAIILISAFYIDLGRSKHIEIGRGARG